MRRDEAKRTSGGGAAIMFAVFAVVCLAAFLSFRGGDVGQLSKLVGNLGGGPLFGNGLGDSLCGIAIAESIVIAWFGLGAFVAPFIQKTDQRPGIFLSWAIFLADAGRILIFF